MIPSKPKLLPRNVAAARRGANSNQPVREIAGNPASTRLESGVGNCFPGLECDLRNLERRFFPFLEVDLARARISVVSVDLTGVDAAVDAGTMSEPQAEIYRQIAAHLRPSSTQPPRAVTVETLTGMFGPLGELTLTVAGFTGQSIGPGRLPPDAWTAVRLLTEGTQVTLQLRRQGVAQRLELKANRARYLDDNGALAAAFLPGEMTQSLCSPWTYDFRDCGCFYWASNHPDIVRPVMPAPPPTDPGWNHPVGWLRGERTVGPIPPPPAIPGDPPANGATRELRYYEIDRRWQELRFVVGGREISGPFAPKTITGQRLESLAVLQDRLRYAAGVEIAVVHEYLTAAYSFKPDAALAGNAALLADVRASRAELMRIAIGEMRHTRAVNDVLRAVSDPGAFTPALRVATKVPGSQPNQFRDVMRRPANPAAIQAFIDIEAPSVSVDGLYTTILLTLQDPPTDEIRARVSDEHIQTIRSVMAEGEDHHQTFLFLQQWLGDRAVTDYLRAADLQPPPLANAAHAALQAKYLQVLELLFSGYTKGRFNGASDVNAARAAMLGPAGLHGAAEAVATLGFLAVFDPIADPRFAPMAPPF